MATSSAEHDSGLFGQLRDRLISSARRIFDTAQNWVRDGGGYRHIDNDVVFHGTDQSFTPERAQQRFQNALMDAFNELYPNAEISTRRELKEHLSKNGLPFFGENAHEIWQDMENVLNKHGLSYGVDEFQGVDSGYIYEFDGNGRGQRLYAGDVSKLLKHDYLVDRAQFAARPGQGLQLSLRDAQLGYENTYQPQTLHYTVSEEEKVTNQITKRMANDMRRSANQERPFLLSENLANNLKQAERVYRNTRDKTVARDLDRLRQEAWTQIDQGLRQNYGVAYEVGENGAGYLRDLESDQDVRVYAREVAPWLAHGELQKFIGRSYDRYHEKLLEQSRRQDPLATASTLTAESAAAAAPNAQTADPDDGLDMDDVPDASPGAAAETLDPQDLVLSRDPDGRMCVFSASEGRELSLTAEQLPAGRYGMDDGRTFQVNENGLCRVDGKLHATPTATGVSIAGREFGDSSLVLSENNQGGYDVNVVHQGKTRKLGMTAEEFPVGRTLKDQHGNAVTITPTGPEHAAENVQALNTSSRRNQVNDPSDTLNFDGSSSPRLGAGM